MPSSPPHNQADGASPSPPVGNSPAPQSDDATQLAAQSKEYLVQRLQALDQQLRVRNADCQRLLQERQELLPYKQKCSSQKELIEALQDKVQLLEVQKASALEAVEALKKQLRNDAHQERLDRVGERLGTEYLPDPPRVPTHRAGGKAAPTAAPPSAPQSSSTREQAPPAPGPTPKAAAPKATPGGTIVKTSSGPQIIYDSSDISSVGFSKQTTVPYDFLGGPYAQQQYLAHCRQGKQGGNNSTDGDDDGDEVSRVMRMAEEEARMDIQYAEVQEHEEKELMDRFNALKNGTTKKK